jgi:hypothetical protein
MFTIFFILLEFLHILMNVCRNLEYDYQTTQFEKTLNTAFFAIIFAKTLRNISIEMTELHYSGLSTYLEDYWNYIEDTAIVCSLGYNWIDFLSLYGILETS